MIPTMFSSCIFHRYDQGSFRRIRILLSVPFMLTALHSLTLAEEDNHERKVLGHQQCMDCHELPVEAWYQSGHRQRSLEIVDSNLRALRFAERLGLNSKTLANDSRCVDCHGTQQSLDHGHASILGGVSCESCHGAAGPNSDDDGWFMYHSGEASLPEDSGIDLATYLESTGMARTDDLYLLAIRCYSCHSVSNEEVVQAGHVAGTHEFELSSWFSGEVRHNFAPYTVVVEDDEFNATASNLWASNHEVDEPKARQRLMFVVGVLAEMDVNLRNRANATKAGSYATAAASRVSAAHMRLRQIAERLDDERLSALVQEIATVRSLLFQPPQASQRPLLLQKAEKVSQTARKFLAKNSGENLSSLDSMISDESKGKVYQP